jgi:hypothetical protein
LRAVRYAKLFVNRVPRHPDNSVRGIDDERHEIARAPIHLAIHEEILQFFAAAEAWRVKAVSRSPVPDGQIATAPIAPNHRYGRTARNCTRKC